MSLRVTAVDLHVLNTRLRMPFRYGIAHMTVVPHLFLRAALEVDGQRVHGVSAEGLPPKWFTKNPATDFKDDLNDMLRVIRQACAFAQEVGPAASVFDLWQRTYEKQAAWGKAENFPPLLWSLGVAMVERAVIEAFCRATRTTFPEAVQRNALGVRLGDIHPELAGRQPHDFLPKAPLRRLIARHTVGLIDPLTDAQVPANEKLHDGLPQSLEACIKSYGLTHFKIKLWGDPAKDLPRLRTIARVISNNTSGGGGAAAFTLDGNENFKRVEPFRELWQAVNSDAQLATFMKGLIFVEQPVHRDLATDAHVSEVLHAWPDRPPMIIDESDGTLDGLRIALACGYHGTSHKNCKGVIKSIANAALIAHLNTPPSAITANSAPGASGASEASGGEASGGKPGAESAKPRGPFILSGEDLCNIGPVALLQDLTAAATLGIEHLERNGHHYFAGLSMLPADLQRRVLDHHSDLYRPHATGQDSGRESTFPALHIVGGAIAIGSLLDAPFGVAFELDPAAFTPLDQWTYESLSS